MKHLRVVSIIAMLSAGCGSDFFFRIPDPAVRYLAFGDSMTAGPANRNYPDFLREFLDAPTETFVNEGKSGETALEGLDRLRFLIEDKIYPNAVVFLYWEGGNDLSNFIGQMDPFLLASPDDPDYPFNAELTSALDGIQASIEATLQAAQGVGMEAYIATYFALAPGVTKCGALPFNIAIPQQTDRADAYIERLNDRIRLAAMARGATLVDIASFSGSLQADPVNYLNCNHLSESGNEIVARIFATLVVPVPLTTP